MTREDAVLGTFEYDYLWERKEKYIFLEKEYEIRISLDNEEDEEFTDIQRQAYMEFNKNKETITDKLLQGIFEYYQSEYEEYRRMYGDMADTYAPVISDKSQLKGLVKPRTICIADDDKNRVLNILFDTKWDIEMGIGIRLINEEIAIVGVQCDVL